MLLADVVAASRTVASTRSRLAKVDTLAQMLRRAPDADQLRAVAAFLTGSPLQGRFGAGWRTLTALTVAPAPEPVITLAEVNAAFTAIARTSGTGSAAARAALFTELLSQCTADEQDFLLRLLTGELRQGALDGVMLDAIARSAEVTGEQVRRAFMLSGSLPETAVAALHGGADALAAFTLRLGRPVRPMLASPAQSLSAAIEELGEVSVEYKLDGARIQVHRDGESVRVFTRTLREITKSVPELVELVRALPCRSAVLDGETLALDDAGRPRPFQETMSRFGASSERELLLRPYFFDCLHLDGRDLLDEPLTERMRLLRSVAGEHLIPGITARANGSAAATEDTDPEAATAAHPDDGDADTDTGAGPDSAPEDIVLTDTDRAVELLERSLAAGHEGVVVKALNSPYAAGRRGRAWQKVKPVHSLDLVVLAAEWGHGRRSGLLSNLHLGARDPDGGPPIMVGKTFKGMTDELLAWQTTQFPAYETHRDDWTVYLRPALVVEIALDGVQVSPRYPGGVALRFARVLRYRPDKEPGDADTIDAIRALLPAKGSGG